MLGCTPKTLTSFHFTVSQFTGGLHLDATPDTTLDDANGVMSHDLWVEVCTYHIANDQILLQTFEPRGDIPYLIRLGQLA